MFFNALPMISFSALSQMISKEIKLPEKKIDEIIKKRFIESLLSIIPP